jgi:hypothetical protein
VSERNVIFKNLTSPPLFSVTIFMSLNFEEEKIHAMRDFIDIRAICSSCKEYDMKAACPYETLGSADAKLHLL